MRSGSPPTSTRRERPGIGSDPRTAPAPGGPRAPRPPRGHALEVALPDGPRGPERERPGAIEGRIRDDLADRPLENADQIARRLEVEEDIAREEPADETQLGILVDDLGVPLHPVGLGELHS